MTDMLVKLFIKNSDNTDDNNVRTSYGILGSIVGMVCNIILFIIKFTIGFLIQSISVTADAFNNLSDAASSVISFVGVKLANRPADKEHPFGHGRYEYIAALIVAFLVVQVGMTCFKNSVSKIIKPEEVKFQLILVIILSCSVLIKVWLGFFNRKLGRKINSTVMKASSADAFGDVIITVAAIISVIAGKISGLKIDGYTGLIVSVLVIISGFNIAKETLEPLLGEAVDSNTYELITKKVESYEDIVGSHDLIVHNYGPSNIMATIHAEVPNNIDIEKAHETIDRIERDVTRELGIFLVIHMDPIEINNSTVIEIKNMVNDIVRELEKKATIHDFRIVNGEEQINLIFDLVVPHEYKAEKEQKLMLDVMEKVSERDSRYQCVITVEHSYIAEK